MGFSELIVFLLFITVAIIVIVSLTRLVNIWIKRKKNKYDDDKFERLAKAFIQFKKDAERRIKNLEAIIADNDELAAENDQLFEEKSSSETIDIDPKANKGQIKTNSDKMENMLHNGD